MAAAPSHVKGKGLYHLEAPCFCNIIRMPLHQGILIPPAFMKTNGHSLYNIVFLKVPVGEAWPIELVQIDGGSWLKKGLQEFGEFYSIQKDYFLLFRYDGQSHFHVSIFDKTCLEIDYPVKITGDHNDDSSVEILGETKEMERENVDQQIWNGTRNPGMSQASWNGVQRSTAITKGGSCEGSSRNPHKPSKNKNPDVCKIAATFKSQHPFFICPMYPSYVSISCNISIPADFIRDHYNAIYTGIFQLRLSGNGTKTWPVHVVIDKETRKMYGGWRRFVMDNKLVVGDICVFELLEGTRTFNVTIYRRS